MTTTVLIIDTNIPFMISIKQALEGTGQFRVAMAASSDAAAESLRSAEYDVALVDFELPGLDVMELLRLLRNLQPDLPVILTLHDELQAERAQFMKVQGMLMKPYSARDLLPRLRDITHHVGADQPSDADRAPAPPAPDGGAVFEDYEMLERAQTGTPDTAVDDPGADEAAGEMPPDGRTRLLDDMAPAASDQRLWFELEDDEADGAADDDVARLFADDDGDYEYEDELPHQADDDGATRLLTDMDGDDTEGDQGAGGATRWVPDDDFAPGHDDLPPDGRTRVLDDDFDPASDTTNLLEWSGPDETRTLQDTEELKRRHETKRLERQFDDPPPVSERDLDGARQFLAADPEGSEEFGDVLDAVAKTSETLTIRTPEDQEFHDLVDSMSQPGAPRKRRTRLEELLASIAADSLPEGEQPEGDALDYVLDALRRSGAPAAPDAAFESADLDDDTTIGQVIDGLFDPAFEGVLAALSGEEMDESEIDEPTYNPDEAAESAERNQRTTGGVGRPGTLPEAAGEPGEPAAPAPREARDSGPVIVEPAVTEEDSRSYPATAALSAMSDEFSLDDLLGQIERKLPPARTRRPRLKPLPSWERDGLLEGAGHLAAMFDHAEGVRHELPTPDEIEAVLDDATPDAFREDVVVDPVAPREAWAESGAAHADTTPIGPDTTAGLVPLPEHDEPPFDLPERDESGEELLSIDELLARADLPPEAGTEEIRRDLARHGVVLDTDYVAERDAENSTENAQIAAEYAAGVFAGGPSHDEIAAAFYEGVQRDERDRPELPPDLPEAAPLDDDERDAYGAVFVVPDEDQLVEMPVDEATQRIEAAISEAEEAEDEAAIAQIAVQLTQYSLESSAQVTLLSQAGRLLAHAGEDDDDVLAELFDAVEQAWAGGSADSNSLIRFVTLPDGGEFLVYSTRIADGMRLSMAFHANTSLRTIRRQARRLSESLDLVPETTGDEAPPLAAVTLPSRPTDIAPPPGLRDEAVSQPEPDLPPRPAPRSDEPYTSYTALWMPYDPGLELRNAFADDLYDWIQEAAARSAWELLDLHIHTDYVVLTVSAPQKSSPDSVVTGLMRDTADRAAYEYPDLYHIGPLWTDGYYVVTPPRELSDREIARIITMQRNAQLEG